MRRFSFRLETVLKVRRQAEKRQKQEYFDQKRRMLEEEGRLQSLEAEIRRAAADAKTRTSRNLEISLEQAFCDYLLVLEGRIRRSRENLATLEEELQRKVAALIQARKAVRVLERLRERKLEEYRKDARRAEQKYFDEVAVLRHPVAEDAGR